MQRVYYNQVYNFSYQWLLVMSTQLVGPFVLCDTVQLADFRDRSVFPLVVLLAASWSTHHR